MVPINWDEFKIFLQKALGDSRAFVNSYWAKIERDFQYQLEAALDWAAHLEHFQAVVKEFNLTTAPNEEFLIWYFRKGLPLFIRTQLDNRGRESNADIDFQARDLQWRSYTTEEVLPTTRRVELIGKKEFAAAALDLNHHAFVVHVAALNISSDSGAEVHPLRRVQRAHLKADEAPTEVPSEYADFADVFSPKLAVELPKHTGINDHAIELVDDRQPPYGPIYSLDPVELETLQTNIENNLANGFIRPSKSPAEAPILFNQKPDGSLQLCVDYRGLNNLAIKNRYPLPLVGESLDRLGRARRFTQLDVTNAYH